MISTDFFDLAISVVVYIEYIAVFPFLYVLFRESRKKSIVLGLQYRFTYVSAILLLIGLASIFVLVDLGDVPYRTLKIASAGAVLCVQLQIIYYMIQRTKN